MHTSETISFLNTAKLCFSFRWILHYTLFTRPTGHILIWGPLNFLIRSKKVFLTLSLKSPEKNIFKKKKSLTFFELISLKARPVRGHETSSDPLEAEERSKPQRKFAEPHQPVCHQNHGVWNFAPICPFLLPPRPLQFLYTGSGTPRDPDFAQTIPYISIYKFLWDTRTKIFCKSSEKNTLSRGTLLTQTETLDFESPSFMMLQCLHIL